MAKQEIQKVVKAKKGIIVDLDKLQLRYSKRIRTGSIALDYALGGGVPRGTLMEYCGPDRSGKTTMAIKLAAEAQKLGRVMFVCSEQEPESSWAEWLGLDISKVDFSRFPCAENALDAVAEFVKSKDYSLIIIDSIAGFPTKSSLSANLGKGIPVGDLVRVVSRFIRNVIYGELGYTSEGENLTTLLVTNQVRVKMQESFAGRSEYVLPVGFPLRHAKIGSVMFNSGHYIYDEAKEKVLGKTVNFEVIKGKAGMLEGYKGAFDLYFERVPRVEHGIDRIMEMRIYGVIMGIITRSGSYFSVMGKKFHGERELLDALYHDEKLHSEVERAIYAYISQTETGEQNNEESD